MFKSYQIIVFPIKVAILIYRSIFFTPHIAIISYGCTGSFHHPSPLVAISPTFLPISAAVLRISG